MRINDVEKVVGVIPQADVVEGRFGLFVANSDSYNYGSREDLPGFRVPADSAEAEAARWCVTFAVSNAKPPFYVAQPDFGFALRYGGFDQAENVPFSATVHMTYPGYKESQTIPSGTPALAYGQGIVTIPSGQYIYNASLRNAGAFVIVANTDEDTTDAGKPKYQATWDDRVVGTVEHYDTATGDLTIRQR